MKNSKRIGKTAELEACKKLNELFGTNFRRSQQFKGTSESPDLVDDDRDDLAIEVKRRKQLNLHDAIDKAKSEAGENQTACVIHKKPRKPWLLTVALEDAPELFRKLSEKR